MATVERPSTHREEVGLLVDLADERFAGAAAAITLGVPLVAFLWGNVAAMFYVHVALGAFWFGLDFFFKFVLGPALEAAPDDAAGAVNARLVPKMVVVAEPLSVGVVGSGVGLAHLLGYLDDPSVWVWVALVVAGLMLLVGFGPLHLVTTRMAVEFSADDTDPERVEALFARAQQWGLLQTVFMLVVLLAMVGMRGVGL